MSLPEVSFADSAWVRLRPRVLGMGACGGEPCVAGRGGEGEKAGESPRSRPRPDAVLLSQHCVAVVHVPGWLFSQNLVHVYKDGHLVKTAPLRCPCLAEVHRAGCGEVWVPGGGAGRGGVWSLGAGSVQSWMQVGPPALL